MAFGLTFPEEYPVITPEEALVLERKAEPKDLGWSHTREFGSVIFVSPDGNVAVKGGVPHIIVGDVAFPIEDANYDDGGIFAVQPEWLSAIVIDPKTEEGC